MGVSCTSRCCGWSRCWCRNRTGATSSENGPRSCGSWRSPKIARRPRHSVAARFAMRSVFAHRAQTGSARSAGDGGTERSRTVDSGGEVGAADGAGLFRQLRHRSAKQLCAYTAPSGVRRLRPGVPVGAVRSTAALPEVPSHFDQSCADRPLGRHSVRVVRGRVGVLARPRRAA